MADDISCTVVKFSRDNSTARIETSLRNNENVTDNKICETVPKYTFCHFLCTFISIVTYIVDIVLACYLCYYFIQENLTYFGLTIGFIILPNLVTTAFSLRWYIIDDDDPVYGRPSVSRWIIRIIVLLLQMGQVLRYVDSIVYGIKIRAASRAGNRQKQTRLFRKLLDEDSDASLLRLFHCFLHAAPQAVLNLTILIIRISRSQIFEINKNVAIFQSWAVLSWLVSVSWSLTSYYRSVRFAREDKENLTCSGVIIQFCWHLMGSVSRVLALSLLAALFPAWMAALCFTHWAIMSAWLALGHQQTAVCASRCEEVAFSLVLGLAYVVAFIAPRDGPTRYSYLVYYLVCFMENTGALVVWCVAYSSTTNPVLYYGAVITQLVTFSLAIVFMLVYYTHWHPSGTSRTLRKSVDFTGDASLEMNKPSYSKNQS